MKKQLVISTLRQLEQIQLIQLANEFGISVSSKTNKKALIQKFLNFNQMQRGGMRRQFSEMAEDSDEDNEDDEDDEYEYEYEYDDEENYDEDDAVENENEDSEMFVSRRPRHTPNPNSLVNQYRRQFEQNYLNSINKLLSEATPEDLKTSLRVLNNLINDWAINIVREARNSVEYNKSNLLDTSLSIHERLKLQNSIMNEKHKIRLGKKAIRDNYQLTPASDSLSDLKEALYNHFTKTPVPYTLSGEINVLKDNDGVYDNVNDVFVDDVRLSPTFINNLNSIAVIPIWAWGYPCYGTANVVLNSDMDTDIDAVNLACGNLN